MDLGEFVEGVALQPLAEFAHVVLEGGRVVWVKVHEDEPLPNLALNASESVLLLVEVEELAFLLNESELAFEVEAPGVVLALELAAHPAGLVAGVFVPNQLIAAMAADVVECVDPVIPGADDDDRRSGGVDLLSEVAPLPRNLLDAADIQPAFAKNRVLLGCVELGVDRVGVVDGGRAELRVMLCPGSFIGLRKSGHSVVLTIGL